MNGEYRTNTSDYVDAMRTIRLVKNISAVLLLVGLVVTLGTFSLVEFTEQLNNYIKPDELHQAHLDAVVAAKMDEMSEQGATEADRVAQEAKIRKGYGDQTDKATALGIPLSMAMYGVKYGGFLVAALMLSALGLGAMLILVGRLAGIGHMLGAWFWAVILLLILVPWQDIFQIGEMGGAFYSLQDLAEGAGRISKMWYSSDGKVSDFERVMYWCRFLAYPIVAGLFLLVVQVRFAAAWRALTNQTVIEDQPDTFETVEGEHTA